MKKVLAGLLPILLCASVALATGTQFGAGLGNSEGLVRWTSIVGVITAPGVDAPVGNIHAGATPWTVRQGFATVNLETGAVFFEVNGLVINGSNSSGTPGPITAVTGTLVCNPGATATVLDTPSTPLSAEGNAVFSGHFNGVPAACGNPLFLIRIATPAGAAGKWIATGAQRILND